MRSVLVGVLMMLLAPALPAQDDYDGLELTQMVGKQKLERGPEIEWVLLQNRDRQPVVGMLIRHGQKEARLYLDLQRWQQFQQLLAEAEKPLEETGPGELYKVGEVVGLEVRFKVTQLRVEVLGKTRLDDRNLLLTALTGASRRVRITMALSPGEREELKKRIDQVNTWLAD